MAVCTITGTFLRANGAPLRRQIVYVQCSGRPGAGLSGIIPDRRDTYYTDNDGEVEIVLRQGMTVTITLGGDPGTRARTVVVPSESTYDLKDLLYPYLASVAWRADGPITADVGDQVGTTVLGTLSDGSEVDITDACTLDVDDGSILQSLGNGTWSARRAGTALVSILSVDESAIDALTDFLGEACTQEREDALTLPEALEIRVT